MTGEDTVWPHSMEAQLQSGSAGDIWNIDKVPMVAAPERTSGRHTRGKLASSERPLGEWNNYRIRCDRGYFRLEVNGAVQNEAIWCEEVPGKICLQSEGAYIEFRNIVLRPYTDMKTHDVTGTPLRTPPLWGLGRNIKLLEENDRELLLKGQRAKEHHVQSHAYAPHVSGAPIVLASLVRLGRTEGGRTV